jgi:predicted DCC family thiol-disulfide oxidoreductase YuxK
MRSFHLFLCKITKYGKGITNLVIQNQVDVQYINEAKEGTHSYVIFDGACGFCNYSAMFIARKDVSDRFILVSNSSDFGRALLVKYNLEKVSSHSIILIEGEGISIKSKAIRSILQEIPGYRSLKFLLRVVPLFIQNLLYDAIAKIRKYLPMKTNCEVPDQRLREKFRL